MNWYKKAQNFYRNAEIEQIDGKWYDDNLVEVQPPVAQPTTPAAKSSQPKSFTVDQYGITFTEGEEYTNWFGIYEVLKINDDGTMQIEYLQSFKPPIRAGDVKVYPMSAQAETIYKARRSEEIEMRLNRIMDLKGTDDSFAMGFLAKNGYISAEVGPRYHKSFPKKYKAITGEDPSKYLGEGYRLSPNDKRWSFTLRVHLPVNLPAALLDKLNFQNMKIRPYGTEINDNALVWGLLNKGFSIGRNDDKMDQISSGLPDDGKKAFMAGATVL